ncbi:MAG: PAS domain S-box protein [Actinomycetota bacterium]
MVTIVCSVSLRGVDAAVFQTAVTEGLRQCEPCVSEVPASAGPIGRRRGGGWRGVGGQPRCSGTTRRLAGACAATFADRCFRGGAFGVSLGWRAGSCSRARGTEMDDPQRSAGPQRPRRAAHGVTLGETRALLSLLHTTATAANEASSVEQAMQVCLDEVCTYFRWPVGHFYTVVLGPPEELVSSAIWHLADPERFDAFRRVTEALRLTRGKGLPGRVLATGAPAWIPRLKDDENFPRLDWTVEAGLCAGYAFPVLAGERVVGVLEFFSATAGEPDRSVVEVMGQVGTQMGRVVERAATAAALQDSEERMRLVVETAGDAFVGIDRDGTILAWNAAAEALFGWPREEAIGRRLTETIIPPRYRAAHGEGLARYLASGESTVLGRRVELEALHRDGHEVPMELAVWPVRVGRDVQFNAFVHDISERRQAEVALREAEERFRRAFDDAPIGMCLVDHEGRILRANQSYCEMLGYSEDALRGMTVGELTYPDDVEASQEPFGRVLAGGLASYRVEKRYVHADGHPVWAMLNVSAVRDDGGRIVHLIGQIEDISARRQAEEALTRQALHDHLTGLPNRSLMLDRLRLALARTRRQPGTVTVMFVDLDNFKCINDSLGHDAGDQVLVTVAQRLQAAVRPADTVCRMGGDEFVVVCEGLDEAEPTEIARRVEAAVSEPFAVDGREVAVTASVGLAVDAGGTAGPEGLLGNADAAMYRAKKAGKARYHVFDDTLRARAGERVRLERGLREALEVGRLGLAYQPIITMPAGDTCGVEALLRYEDPERGVLVADQFIDVAEDTGLIIPLGAWVLGQACREAAGWRERGWQLPVTVNLGAREMARATLVSTVRATLDEAGLAPEGLCLDLPEAAVVVATGSTQRALIALADIGVCLGIDGWGNTAASLTALGRLPVSYLKLDRAVVRTVSHHSPTATALVAAGTALRLAIIAEGVESAEQLRGVRDLGCTAAQGNHLAPPQDLEVLLARLAGEGGLTGSAGSVFGRR